MRMPGMSKNSALRLLAELGPDFVEKFPDARHFESWANLVPNNKISGGKLLSSKVPNKNNPVGQVFRQCANALWRSNEPLGDYFRHIKARSGHLQAMVATGKKMAESSIRWSKTKKNMTCQYMPKARRKLLKEELKSFKQRFFAYRMSKLNLGSR